MRYSHFFVCICFHFALAQHSGYVTYQTYFGSDEQFDQLQPKDLENMRQFYEVKEFILEFDKNQSVNYQKEIVSPDLKYSYRNAFYYQNKSESLYLRTEDDAMFGKITITDSIKTAWKLTNETKLINNILCYKATQEAQEFRGSESGQNYKVIAWYAPEISAPFGLFEYGGLPGLILELQIRNVTYGADKIVLSPMKKTRLEKPKTQGNVMTEKDYIEKMDSVMRSYKR